MYVVSNGCLIIYGHVCAFVDYTMLLPPTILPHIRRAQMSLSQQLEVFVFI